MLMNDSVVVPAPSGVGIGSLHASTYATSDGDVVYRLSEVNGTQFSLVGSARLALVSVAEVSGNGSLVIRTLSRNALVPAALAMRPLSALVTPTMIDNASVDCSVREVISVLSSAVTGGGQTVVSVYVDRSLCPWDWTTTNASYPHSGASRTVAAGVSKQSVTVAGFNFSSVNSELFVTFAVEVRTFQSGRVALNVSSVTVGAGSLVLLLSDNLSLLRVRATFSLDAFADGATAPVRGRVVSYDASTVTLAFPSFSSSLTTDSELAYGRSLPEPQQPVTGTDSTSSTSLWPLLALLFLLLAPVCLCNCVCVTLISVVLCAVTVAGCCTVRLPQRARKALPNEHALTLHQPLPRDDEGAEGSSDEDTLLGSDDK